MNFGFGGMEVMKTFDCCVYMVPLMHAVDYNGGRTSHPSWDRTKLFNIFLKQTLLDNHLKKRYNNSLVRTSKESLSLSLALV